MLSPGGAYGSRVSETGLRHLVMVVYEPEEALLLASFRANVPIETLHSQQGEVARFALKETWVEPRRDPDARSDRVAMHGEVRIHEPFYARLLNAPDVWVDTFTATHASGERHHFERSVHGHWQDEAGEGVESLGFAGAPGSWTFHAFVERPAGTTADLSVGALLSPGFVSEGPANATLAEVPRFDPWYLGIHGDYGPGAMGEKPPHHPADQIIITRPHRP